MEAGWDFVAMPDGPHDIWAKPAGGGYPILWCQLPPTFALPTFSGGTGEPGDAYLISTTEELNLIGNNPRLMERHFKLINDLDMAGTDFYIIGGDDFYPYDTYSFAGVFDGNYHVISNFTHISANRDKVGLFGYIDGSNAQLKNVGLNDPNIVVGSNSYAGALVGQLIRGMVSNSFAQNGNISGDGDYIGGLVGYNAGEITDCGTIIDVFEAGFFGANYVGGLVGLNSGTITGCSAGGSLTGNSSIGGLVGKNTNTIIRCYSICNVEALNRGGGLVGENEGEVTHCWANANISKGRYLGGLVGINRSVISYCGSEGNVTSDIIDNYIDIGGLAGYNSGTIFASYSSSSVLGFESARQAGGLIGVNTGQINDCYCLGDVEAGNYLGGLVGVNAGAVSNCFSTSAVTILMEIAHF
jgi:hypothetical protein